MNVPTPARGTTLPAKRLPRLMRARRRRKALGARQERSDRTPQRRSDSDGATQRQTPRMDVGWQWGQEGAESAGGGGTRERDDRPHRETTARRQAHCPQMERSGKAGRGAQTSTEERGREGGERTERPRGRGSGRAFCPFLPPQG